MTRFIITLTACLFLTAVSVSAVVAARYSIVAISPANTPLVALNERGQAVGSSSTRAVIWEGGNVQELDSIDGVTSRAYAINESGQVVGESTTPDGWRACLWQNGKTTNLGAIPAWQEGSAAYDINDMGQVIGLSGNFHGGGIEKRRAFLWSDGILIDLKLYHSTAYSINNQSQVVGSYNNLVFPHPTAFVWENGGVTDLPRLYAAAEARHINDSRQIVGWSRSSGASATEHAVIWELNESMEWTIHDLGTLGGTMSMAYGLNNHGQAVGESLRFGSWDAAPGARGAFIWEKDSGMVDLNTLLVSSEGWDLQRAWSINDAGQILGTGMLGGQQKYFLLNPVPEPSSLLTLLFGLTGVGRIMWRRRRS